MNAVISKNKIDICKQLTSVNHINSGFLCLEHNIDDIVYSLSQKLERKVSLYQETPDSKTQNLNKNSLINFLNYNFLIEFDSPGMWFLFDFSKYISFLLGALIAFISIIQSSFGLKHQKMVFKEDLKGVLCKKSLIENLFFKKNSNNTYGLLSDAVLEATVNYFYQEIKLLNLEVNIVAVGVEKCKINLFCMQRLLLHFLADTMNKIKPRGKINISVCHQNDHVARLTYHDTSYGIKIDNQCDTTAKKNKENTSIFFIDTGEMNQILEINKIYLSSNIEKYKGRTIVLEFPVITKNHESKVLSILRSVDGSPI